eukprot:TRINITY_DN10198_c0_g1_i2.p1 TRINITY_DN10198_c0_g1~~TRINITY_DN10198_c0_g1_i2.p1  ORF type:complete len:553 (+),score=67.66 TRINITY_DN10198_c0_g1_i2:81-1661(+)
MAAGSTCDPSYYKVLGLSEDCTQDEIRAARRRLADSAGGDDEKDIRTVREACSVLSDPVSRAAYDAGRRAAQATAEQQAQQRAAAQAQQAAAQQAAFQQGYQQSQQALQAAAAQGGQNAIAQACHLMKLARQAQDWIFSQLNSLALDGAVPGGAPVGPYHRRPGCTTVWQAQEGFCVSNDANCNWALFTPTGHLLALSYDPPKAVFERVWPHQCRWRAIGGGEGSPAVFSVRDATSVPVGRKQGTSPPTAGGEPAAGAAAQQTGTQTAYCQGHTAGGPHRARPPPPTCRPRGEPAAQAAGAQVPRHDPSRASGAAPAPSPSASQRQGEQPEEKVEDRPWKCDQCDAAFHSEGALQMHTRRHAAPAARGAGAPPASPTAPDPELVVKTDTATYDFNLHVSKLDGKALRMVRAFQRGEYDSTTQPIISRWIDKCKLQLRLGLSVPACPVVRKAATQGSASVPHPPKVTPRGPAPEGRSGSAAPRTPSQSPPVTPAWTAPQSAPRAVPRRSAPPAGPPPAEEDWADLLD